MPRHAPPLWQKRDKVRFVAGVEAYPLAYKTKTTHYCVQGRLLEGQRRVSRTRGGGWTFVVAIAMATSIIPHARAQTTAAPTGAAQGAPAQPAPAPTPSGYGQEIAPTGEYQEGLPIGTWILYPSVFVGAELPSRATAVVA